MQHEPGGRDLAAVRRRPAPGTRRRRAAPGRRRAGPASEARNVGVGQGVDHDRARPVVGHDAGDVADPPLDRAHQRLGGARPLPRRRSRARPVAGPDHDRHRRPTAAGWTSLLDLPRRVGDRAEPTYRSSPAGGEPEPVPGDDRLRRRTRRAAWRPRRRPSSPRRRGPGCGRVEVVVEPAQRQLRAGCRSTSPARSRSPASAGVEAGRGRPPGRRPSSAAARCSRAAVKPWPRSGGTCDAAGRRLRRSGVRPIGGRRRVRAARKRRATSRAAAATAASDRSPATAQPGGRHRPAPATVRPLRVARAARPRPRRCRGRAPAAVSPIRSRIAPAWRGRGTPAGCRAAGTAWSRRRR